MNSYHREQLKKLAIGLLSEPVDAQFDMSYWASGGNIYDRIFLPHQVKNECGTAACAFGHAVFYCDKPVEDETWNDYRERIIGFSYGRLDCFMFDCCWPNDKEQAVARIYLVLTDMKKMEEGIGFDRVYPVPTLEQLEAIIP